VVDRDIGRERLLPLVLLDVVGDDGNALDALGAKQFAVAVTDIWMAGIDGLKLIKMIRESNRSLPILAMTGGGPRLTIETAGSLAEVWGAERVFVKPFDEDQLIQTIDAIVARGASH